MKRRHIAGTGALLCALLLGWLWRPTPTVEAPIAAPPTAPPPAPRQTARSPEPLPVLPAAEQRDLYEALSDEMDGLVIQCPAPGIDEGVYRGREPSSGAPAARYVMVRGGQVTALVESEQGAVVLEQGGILWGTVTWEGATCAAHSAEVAVRGRVVWPDGAPAAGHAVPACRFGEWVTTDEEGRFETTMLQGSTCHLIAFVETEDAFGRGPSVSITAAGPDPIEDVVLVLPGEEALWSEEEQAALAEQLADMAAAMLERRFPGVDEGQERVREQATAEGRALLRRWDALAAAEQAMIEAELDRLDDPDERMDALRDIFLKQY